MRAMSRIIPSLLAFVLMFTVGVCLAAPAPGAKSFTTKASTKTTTKSATTKSTTSSAVKATHKRSDVLASAEDLTGTISMVDPSGKEVTILSDGVPYDFDLTPRTKVELSNNKIPSNQLASENNKQATIHFVPTSRGNMAKSIDIGAS